MSGLGPGPGRGPGPGPGGGRLPGPGPGANVPGATPVVRPDDDSSLVDLLDRVIDRGVVVTGDVVLSVAGVDLVHVGLQLVLRGVDEPGGVT